MKTVKIIATTGDDLTEYDTASSSISRILSKDDETVCEGPCSVSGLVGDRYIFVVSDKNHGQPSRDVVFYDIQQSPPYERNPGPLLVGAKARPTLIIMGSKLFAFSFLLFHKYKNSPLDSKPRGEVLDTNSKLWKWTPLRRFPKLPYPKGSVAYTIVSFAVLNLTSTLFLTLGESADSFRQGIFSFSYDVNVGKWEESEPLPFRREGKFVGDYCYGFSFASESSLYFESFDLSCYQLINHPDNSTFSWVELSKYSLPSTLYPPIHSFYSLEINIFAIIRVRRARKRSPPFLDLDVVELVPSEGSCKLLDRYSSAIEDEIEAVVGASY